MKEIYVKEENFGNDIFVDGLTIAEKENGHYYIETVKGPMASGITDPYNQNSSSGWSIEVSTDSEEFDRGSDEYSLLLALKNFVDDYKVNTDEDKKEYLIQEIESALRELVLYKWFKTDETEIKDVTEETLKKIEENDIAYFTKTDEDEAIYSFLKEQNVLNTNHEEQIKDVMISLNESAFVEEFARFEGQERNFGHRYFSLTPFIEVFLLETNEYPRKASEIELSEVVEYVEAMKKADFFITDYDGETDDYGQGGYFSSNSTGYCDCEFKIDETKTFILRVGYELEYDSIPF